MDKHAGSDTTSAEKTNAANAYATYLYLKAYVTYKMLGMSKSSVAGSPVIAEAKEQAAFWKELATDILEDYDETGLSYHAATSPNSDGTW